MNKHYVYKITNNNPTDERKYYIGVRTAKKSPEEDLSYMGSSKQLDESIGKTGIENFSKEILSTWETRELANKEELRLHWEINVSVNPEYYNRSNVTATGFCTYGESVALDKRDGTIKIVSKEEFETNDYYTGVNKGTVTVIDKRNGIRKNVSKKDFEKFDYYVSIAKGTTKVIDKRDGKVKTVSNEDYHKYDYYEFIQKGKLPVIDSRDGSTKHVTKEEYKKYDYYVNPCSKKINIFDNNDNLIVSCFGNFGKVCEEKGLPKSQLAKSYRNNTKVFEGLPKNHLVRVQKSDIYHFRGWYARIVE